MSRTTPFLVLSVLALVLVALPALASNVATFQGSTLGFSKCAVFDAQRPFGSGSSCMDGSTPTYQWTFVEDGVIRFGNPVAHTFTAPFGAYTVELKITCADGTMATHTRPVCFSIGVGGCVFPDRGYN